MSAGAVDIAKPAIAMPLQRNEDWHSFSVPVPHHFADDANQFSNFVAFSTWVFSPREQTIPVGVFHGRHWLNGTAVAKGTDSIDPVSYTHLDPECAFTWRPALHSSPRSMAKSSIPA